MTAALIIIGIIIVFILLYVFLRKFVRREAIQIKGDFGEKKVRKVLEKTKENHKYIFNNIMIVDDGKSSQIDHILINKAGIYVVETKNYSGIITGHENQREWTQTLAYGNVKNTFYNPLKQNATHIYRLKKLLDVEVPIYSVVVFINAHINFIDAENVYDIPRLKRLLSDIPSVISDEEIDNIAEKISSIKSDDISLKQHVDEIHSMQINIENGICPRCGGELVLKNGKNGQFYGCTNFPKCRFTKNIE